MTDAVAGYPSPPAPTAWRQERRERVLDSTLTALGLSLLGVWLHNCVDIYNLPLMGLSTAATMLLALAWRLSRSRPGMSAAILAGGLTALTALGLHLLPLPLVSLLTAVPILCGALLFGPIGALIGAGAIGLSLVTAPVPGIAPGWGVFLSLSLGVLAWAGLRPWEAMLAESYGRGLEARSLVERLRDNQGKLNRTIKALDTAYRLLESSNYALAAAREEAEQLRALKSRFATGLSHELRTPLNIILGFSELVYRNPSLYDMPPWSDSLRRDLAQIQRNAGYLSELLDDILDLARMDANAMPVRRDHADIAEVIEQAVSGVESLAQEKGIAIERECAPGLPSVYVDVTRIRQVLYNLLTNAIRAADRGKVTVGARVEGPNVVVQVRDTGPGIPPEAVELIFDEYRQLDAENRGDRGKGLGLAIARQFVRLHGGRIWAESDPGRGTTVFFTVPLQEREMVRLTRPRSGPLPRTRLKPLLAVTGGNQSAAGYLRRRLEEYEVKAVGGPGEPEPDWTELRPAAVIQAEPAQPAAEGSPRNGTELPEGVPRIRLTLPGPYRVLEASGFDAVLTKPVSGPELMRAIERYGKAEGESRLLIADDDRGFVQLLRRLLQANGHGGEVWTAYNGADALRLARRHRPDLVLLDVVMPGLSGLEVLRALREDEGIRETPVLAVTAAVAGEEEVEALPAAFAVMDDRPFPEDYLLGLLRAALNRRANPGSVAVPPGDRLATPAS